MPTPYHRPQPPQLEDSPRSSRPPAFATPRSLCSGSRPADDVRLGFRRSRPGRRTSFPDATPTTATPFGPRPTTALSSTRATSQRVEESHWESFAPTLKRVRLHAVIWEGARLTGLHAPVQRMERRCGSSMTAAWNSTRRNPAEPLAEAAPSSSKLSPHAGTFSNNPPGRRHRVDALLRPPGYASAGSPPPAPTTAN